MTIWHLSSICGVIWNKNDSEKMTSIDRKARTALGWPVEEDEDDELGVDDLCCPLN